MLSHRGVWLVLIVTVMRGAGLLDQDATAGKLLTGSSPIGPMVSGVPDGFRRPRWFPASPMVSGVMERAGWTAP